MKQDIGYIETCDCPETFHELAIKDGRVVVYHADGWECEQAEYRFNLEAA